MATYVTLLKFTERGVKDVKDSSKRAAELRRRMADLEAARVELAHRTRVRAIAGDVTDAAHRAALVRAAGELGDPVRSYVARLIAIEDVLAQLPVR